MKAYTETSASATARAAAAQLKARIAGPAMPTELTLLDKYLTVVAASTDKGASACDLAVLLQIMDYYNAQKGYAYPSMDTLAFNTKRSKRAVVDSVGHLIELGYLQLVRRGNRHTSNRYAPIVHGYVRPVRVDHTMVQSTSPDRDMVQSTSPDRDMVQSTAAIGAVSRSLLVKPTSPDPILEPGQIRERENVSGVLSDPTTAALGVGPSWPSQLAVPRESGPKHAAFWATYPKRQSVAQANAEIDKAIASGVSMATIVDGARRYAEWVKSQPWGDDPKYTKGAPKFIQAQGWLDDYVIFTPKPKVKAEPKVKASGKAKTSKKANKKAKAAKKPETEAEGDWHAVEITASAIEKGTSLVEIRFEVLSGPWARRVVFGRFSLREEIGREQLGQLSVACGIAHLGDTSEILGKRLEIRLGQNDEAKDYRALLVVPTCAKAVALARKAIEAVNGFVETKTEAEEIVMAASRAANEARLIGEAKAIEAQRAANAEWLARQAEDSPAEAIKSVPRVATPPWKTPEAMARRAQSDAKREAEWLAKKAAEAGRESLQG